MARSMALLRASSCPSASCARFWSVMSRPTPCNSSTSAAVIDDGVIGPVLPADGAIGQHHGMFVRIDPVAQSVDSGQHRGRASSGIISMNRVPISCSRVRFQKRQ